jgi:NAD(P)-dependent dehydrogenase (short-subunit alcohol dehydrogenase family)
MSVVPHHSGRVVVITGASAGVGRAIAHRFAREGWRIGLIARGAEALEETRREVEQLGGIALALPADVADAEAVTAAADRVVRTYGTIDVWINDAMVTVFSPVWDMAAEEFRRVTEVTYLGFVHGTMAALRHMRPADRGHIIQIGSALAYRGIPLQSAYCGAKHAIRGFTDSLRTELIHDRSRIRLTMMELPAVNTPQFDWARTHMPRQPRPVAPVVQPEVIANAVFQAVRRPRREYWIGLSTLKVILGNVVLPAWLDHYLAKVAFSAQETNKPVATERADNPINSVGPLHRTRGRFGAEADDSAIVVAGPVARIVPLMLGALAAFGAGLFIGARGIAPDKNGRRASTVRHRG